MHMADALLSPAVGAAFWAGTAGSIAFCARKLKESMDEKMIPLMGVLGAFIFAAQMINFTIPATGSSGHLGGGMILAVILGPYAAFIVMASVLTVQAFFFADGGLLALGCNIWNLGAYPCFIAYPLIYKLIAKAGSAPGRLSAAAVVSAAAGLQLGSFSVVMQTILSGQSELPFSTFLPLMQLIHLAIGIVEGLVTAGVINFIQAARPALLEGVPSPGPLSSGVPDSRVLVSLLIVSVLTAGTLSWFASSNPDGLEWSIQKVLGKKVLPEQEGWLASVLGKLQEKTSFLPDYGMKQTKVTEDDNGNPSRPAVDSGRSSAGIIGAGIVLAAILLIGIVIRAIRSRSP